MACEFHYNNKIIIDTTVFVCKWHDWQSRKSERTDKKISRTQKSNYYKVAGYKALIYIYQLLS
jgi:hypothetical protein